MLFWEDDVLASWIKEKTEGYELLIKTRKGRKRKLGDYKFIPPSGHQITINAELDKWTSFFVLTHELAHMFTRLNFESIVKPHGSEWKSVFSLLIEETVAMYPNQFQEALFLHAKRPTANLFLDEKLHQLFFPQPSGENQTALYNLNVQDAFIFRQRTFEIIEKKRKRYLCRDLRNRKLYLINSHATIERNTT